MTGAGRTRALWQGRTRTLGGGLGGSELVFFLSSSRSRPSGEVGVARRFRHFVTLLKVFIFRWRHRKVIFTLAFVEGFILAGVGGIRQAADVAQTHAVGTAASAG